MKVASIVRAAKKAAGTHTFLSPDATVLLSPMYPIRIGANEAAV